MGADEKKDLMHPCQNTTASGSREPSFSEDQRQCQSPHKMMKSKSLPTSVLKVNTSLNSFVALIRRFLRVSTTVVEWLVVSCVSPFWELERS